jgi:hypothetical protein
VNSLRPGGGNRFPLRYAIIGRLAAHSSYLCEVPKMDGSQSSKPRVYKAVLARDGRLLADPRDSDAPQPRVIPERRTLSPQPARPQTPGQGARPHPRQAPHYAQRPQYHERPDRPSFLSLRMLFGEPLVGYLYAIVLVWFNVGLLWGLFNLVGFFNRIGVSFIDGTAAVVGILVGALVTNLWWRAICEGLVARYRILQLLEEERKEHEVVQR